MAYVPKTLMVGKCVRCGKKIYKGERRFLCSKCNVYICPLCHKKVHEKCPICGTRLEEV